MLSLKNVHKQYKEAGKLVSVLQDINLSISQGEFVAIVGPSGSGKSTLLNILGLLDKPSRGQYHFDGQNISVLSKGRLAKLRNQKIGFVFQSFMLLPRMSVMENVEMPLLYSKCSRRERKSRARDALSQVGLISKLRNRAMNLSGGEKQRVAIARSLVNHPDVILADEPTGNLDEVSKQEILHIFSSLHQQGKTIILVTHDMEVAACANRILKIQGGKLTELAGNTEFHNPIEGINGSTLNNKKMEVVSQ